MRALRPMKNIPHERNRGNKELEYDMECFEMNDLSRVWSCIIADDQLLAGDQSSSERHYKKMVYEFLEKLDITSDYNYTKWNVIKYGNVVGLNLSENRKILLYHKRTWNDRMKGFDQSNVLDLNKKK